MPGEKRVQKGRVVRALKKRAPRVQEGEKNAMFVRGLKTNEVVSKALSNLYLMKKPAVLQFNKRNPFHPFDDTTGLEFIANKSDSSLFVFGSHSKKRPQSLTFGRFFDYNLLDMVEVSVDKFIALEEFKIAKWATGSKPCIIFQGQEFEQVEDMKKFANILLDFFRGSPITEVNLAGLDRVIVCTSHQDKVYLRHYTIALKKSGGKIPRVELNEVGPRIDMHVRRTKVPSEDLAKEAFKHNKKGKKSKNVSVNQLKDKLGHIYVNQDLADIPRKNPKALSGGKRVAEASDATIKKPRLG